MAVTIKTIAKEVQGWIKKHREAYDSEPSQQFLENILNKLYSDVLAMRQKDLEDKLKKKYKKENEDLRERARDAINELENVRSRQLELIAGFLQENEDITLARLFNRYNDGY